MDRPESRVWLALLRPGDLVIDAGANYGYWSLVASRCVGPTGRVVAIEAVPVTATKLRTNLTASRAENVEVVSAALSDKSGTETIHVFAGDEVGGLSSLGVPKGLNETERVKVQATTLDEIVAKERRSPKLVKLDIEGSELAALRGGAEVLANEDAPVVTWEWNPATAKPLGWHPKQALDLFRDCGFSSYLATNSGLVTFRERTDLPEWSPMVWSVKAPAHKTLLKALLTESRR